MAQELVIRNAKIYQRWKAGETQKALAESYNLCPERIRQLIHRGTVNDPVNVERRESETRIRVRAEEEIMESWKEDPKSETVKTKSD